MKIIRVTTFLDYGGIERKMANIAKWKDSNEWIFIALGHGGVAERQIRNEGKRVICLNTKYQIPSLQTIFLLYKLFKEEKPDVVHTAGAEANFHGIIAAKLARVPIKISEEIGVPNQSRLAKIIFSLIFKIPDYIVGESQAVVNAIQTNYGLPKNRVKKIFNFIPSSPIIAAPREADDLFRIVMVSRLVKVKNIQAVLKIIPNLLITHPNIVLTIVGEGEEEQDLKNLATQLNINNNVEFAGFAPSPYPFLKRSDLFLLNSMTEGFSNSLLEAMNCGIPVLSTRVGGADDMIDDGVNGWLITPDDNDELLYKLKEILALNKGKLMTIGSNGQKTVQKSFTLHDHINSLLSLYNRS